ncbi:MAG: TetR/AcrR family transcriptional regulator [Oscillospiraceae bacterium]
MPNQVEDAQPVNQPKTKRGQETMDKICWAAEQIFCECGYYKASVSAITRLAEVSAGTFYIYFDSKFTLYEYLLSQYGHKIRRHISTAIAQCTTRREMEREGLRAWLAFVAEHQYVFNITWESLFIDKKLFDDYYANFSAAYVRQLEVAKKKGELMDLDTEVLSFALMGIANFIGLHWVVMRENQNIDYVVEQAMKIIDGIFPPELPPHQELSE